MLGMTITAALLRLGFLVLWAFFALFEERVKVLIWTLAGALMLGNIAAIAITFLMGEAAG